MLSVILSVAKNLFPRYVKILRCAQNDKEDGTLSPTSPTFGTQLGISAARGHSPTKQRLQTTKLAPNYLRTLP